MEDWAVTLEGSSIAQYLRFSRWGYAGVSAAHILGIALLVGSIVPLNLRLLGIWQRFPVEMATRMLVPSALTGLLLAIATGALLFSARAGEYVTLWVFALKIFLVALGTLSACAAHWRFGFGLTAAPSQLAPHASVSLVAWLGALICGRMIAFVGN